MHMQCRVCSEGMKSTIVYIIVHIPETQTYIHMHTLKNNIMHDMSIHVMYRHVMHNVIFQSVHMYVCLCFRLLKGFTDEAEQDRETQSGAGESFA